MISDFGDVLHAAWDALGMEMTLYGFSFSWRGVMLWSMVAGLLLWFIGRCFGDE